jgi:phosphomannomutase
MINVSPIGRNCSVPERVEYEKFDLEHKIRENFIAAIKKEFPDLGLT